MKATMKRYKSYFQTICFLLGLLILTGTAVGSEPQEKRPLKNITILCYHHISHGPPNDPTTIPEGLFAQQIEYLRTHGYNFISAQDLLDAQKGKRVLPAKPVLLTFDDAYVSYHDFVVPLLTRLHIPSVVAVVGRWIDDPPPKLVAPVMSWKQLRELARNPLVEIASHTFGLHTGIRYTPQGNVGPAAAVYEYFPMEQRYETDAEFRRRLGADMLFQKRLFEEKIGKAPRILVWPYGRYNKIGVEEAERFGMPITFTTEEGLNSVEDLHAARRFFLEYDTMANFIKFISMKNPKPMLRAVQVDLDLIYDPSPFQMNKNLGMLIDRLVAMKVNTVFLQAFADPDGDGVVDSTYFPNRVLPVRANIFPWACHQISIRNINVYAWMPTLSLKIPDKGLQHEISVKDCRNGKDRTKLSPFHPKTKEILGKLYEDMARHSLIAGVLFQDDAVVDDNEDCNTYALASFYNCVHHKDQKEPSAEPFYGYENAPDPDDASWIGFKTSRLSALLETLKEKVRRYRPEARFARNIFSEAILNPESEKWFAQSFDDYLHRYDYTVVMAYPQMEGHGNDWYDWLNRLTDAVGLKDKGFSRTVFKIQTYDWTHNRWVSDGDLVKEIRTLEENGVRHIGYYPDNVFENRPGLKDIKMEMSIRDFPFVPKGIIE